jgi:hypothetical protein
MPQKKRKVPPILWTILCVLVLALASTPYAKRANTILIAVRLGLIMMFSLLVVREWWKFQNRAPGRNVEADAAHNLLRRWRRWVTDEQGTPEQQSAAFHIVEGGCHNPSPPGMPHWSAADSVRLVLIVLAIAAFALWWYRR